MKPGDFSPDAILRLAQHNPVVDACLKEWRMGRLRWDEALALAVIRQSIPFVEIAL